MRHFPTITILFASAWMLASCANERKVSYTDAEPQGIDRFGTSMDYKVDAEGQIQPGAKQERRSSFESQGSYAGYSPQSKGSFSRGEYQAKAWSQNKGYQAKAYQGRTDGKQFMKEPHFAKQQSTYREGQAGASGQMYGVNQYQGGGSVERGRAFSKHSDPNTHSAAGSYVEPEIRSLSEVNQMSVEETNMMLGR